MLFLGIKGRINFLQLERFSNRRESGFRYFFEKRFSFMMKDELLKTSQYIAVDAYFSKPKFIHSLVKVGFHLVSRLRDDADLQYLFVGEPQKGRGRPKKYDGKIDFKNLKLTHVREVSKQDKERIYSLKAYSRTIKTTLSLFTQKIQKENGITKYISVRIWSKTDRIF